MNPTPEVEHRLSNQFARRILQSLTEVAGTNGMHAVFRLAGLLGLIDALPPEDQAKEFDAANLSAIFRTIQDLYGLHGGRSLAFKAGQMTLADELNLHSLEEDTLADFHVVDRVQKGLESVRSMLQLHSDQHIDLQYDENQAAWHFDLHDCAVCQGWHAQDPVCAFIEGLLDQALFQFSGGSKFQVQETTCIAAGSESCQFHIQIPQPENPPFTL